MDNIFEIITLLILGTIFGIELFNLFIPFFISEYFFILPSLYI